MGDEGGELTVTLVMLLQEFPYICVCLHTHTCVYGWNHKYFMYPWRKAVSDIWNICSGNYQDVIHLMPPLQTRNIHSWSEVVTDKKQEGKMAWLRNEKDRCLRIPAACKLTAEQVGKLKIRAEHLEALQRYALNTILIWSATQKSPWGWSYSWFTPSGRCLQSPALKWQMHYQSRAKLSFQVKLARILL